MNSMSLNKNGPLNQNGERPRTNGEESPNESPNIDFRFGTPLTFSKMTSKMTDLDKDSFVLPTMSFSRRSSVPYSSVPFFQKKRRL